uniref:ATP-dependent DNA helicase n=1 Tax=Cajanus cajan TaxID=3821 RepID=A0A151QX00_CAJCA|nr:ATP-dependent DNA helicase PIF1 [Cajanus cajan]
MPRVIQEELSIQVDNEDLESLLKLNNDQLIAFNAIMDVINNKQSQVFFVDGPRGTGKTFLYRTLIAKVRSKGQIVLATTSSGIVVTLLPGGRTAHSRFKIPINVEADSFCFISKQSDLAKLIREITTIIWDEAPMTNRYAFEALDRSLKDILDCNAPFGGKIMILGGDFCQVLPVVLKDKTCDHYKIIILQNIMRIGDGNEPTKCDDMVKVPHQIEITWEGENSIQKLIRDTFPQLQSHTWDASYMVERAILTPKNEDVQKLNDIIINHFLGEERELLSFDEVEGDTHNLYQQEYLHSITPGGFPPHDLKVKKGAPLMLLRNIDPKAGLCNGTRLLCRGFFMNMLGVEILTGHNIGKRSFLPRIKHKTTESAGLPFVLIRKQFPMKLSFAITINKSQGQTILNVGIYLPRHVFSRGQLYVALSRVV